ncbi:MAG: hypothetical protein IJ037_09200 [Clostridia bacterium]|nr:hypothetical protein [Clostridia bacterium]
MKKLLSLILAALMLAGCTAGTTPGETASDTAQTEASDPLYTAARLDLTGYENHADTSLKKLADLTPFRTAEEVSGILAYPMIAIGTDTIAVSRNFPADLSPENGGFMQYLINGQPDHPREIELYAEPGAEPVMLSLPDEFADAVLVHHALHINPDGTYSLRTSVTEDGVMTEYLIGIGADGELLFRRESPSNVGDLVLPYRDRVYTLMCQQSTQLFYPNDLLCDSGNGNEIAATDVLSFTIQGGTLYYLTERVSEEFTHDKQLWAMDPETGDSVLIGEISAAGTNEVRAMAYDDTNRVLYTAGYSALYGYSLDTGKSAKVMEANDGLYLLGAGNGMIAVTNGLYQASIYETTADLRSADAAKTSLNICLNNGTKGQFTEKHREAVRAMNANGYPVKISETYLSDNTDEYNNTMAKKLMAGDTDFDIFEISSAMLIEMGAGYCAELTDYPLLAFYYDQMLPGMKELCSLDGVTVLWPRAGMYAHRMMLNTDLAEGTYKIPATIAELETLMDSVTLKDGAAFMDRTSHGCFTTYLVTQFISNFMAQRIDDDTARADLAGILSLMAKLEGSTGKTGFAVTGISDMLRYADTSWTTDNSAAFPLIGEGYGNVISATFYAVNPNSPNFELAALFLAHQSELDLAAGASAYASDDPILVSQLSDPVRAYNSTAFQSLFAQPAYSIFLGETTPEKAADLLLRQIKMMRDE